MSPEPSKERQSFLGKHNLDASMSRRGNCNDNAVAESFFQLLQRRVSGGVHT
jgi:putative transposase